MCLFHVYSPADLGFFYHGTSDLLSLADLPRAQGTFSSEVKAQAVRGDQGAPLVCLPQNPPQGEVQDVCGGVVAHDGPTTSLEREYEQTYVQ